MEINEIKIILDEQKELFQTHFAQIDQRFAQMDDRFAQMDQRFDEFAFTIKESFNKMDDGFDVIEFRLNEHDKRFDANDKRHEELKHMVYSNGDAIAQMQKTMDMEFSAATAQRTRLSERIGRLEHTHGFA